MISKKDLLKETKISYGQLYRWKRESLIPEEWFIKQSSYTGQETFFPREKILNRIKAIQELKDKYSLEELSKILSPEISQRSFTKEDLEIIEEINRDMILLFIKVFEKFSFSFIETIIIIAFSQFKNEFYEVSEDNIVNMIKGIKKYCEKLKNTEYMLLIFNKSRDYFAVLVNNSAEIYADKNLELIKTVKLDDISNIIKIKYKNSLNFKFD